MPDRTYDPVAILAALQAHGVRFVVIGGIAAIAHGSPLPTEDVDITPDRSDDNVHALVNALTDLEAKLRTPDGPVDFPIDARLFSGDVVWTLTTRAGDLDVCFEPAGTRGYDDLRRDAIAVEISPGSPVLVASLLDVIRSKEAAGRAKDRAQLPALRETLEVIRERERRG